MSAVRSSLAALLVLAGCGGNPFPGNTGGGGTPNETVPAVVRVNMNSASYTPGNATIKINMTSQDATDLTASYARNAAFDVGGYQAYTYQESSSNRYVVALVKETGSVKGLVAVEGGQFANYHGGGDFVRADVFSIPASGVGPKYTYSGSYVGMMNIGEPVSGPGGDLDPTRAYRTTGRALITADFTEMSVSGGVDNRAIVDTLYDGNGDPDPTLNPLDTISMFETGVTSEGAFQGKVRIGTTEVGDYAGIFAGLDASQVATLLVFKPYKGSQFIKEHGLIVLDNCASAGGPACP
jgi:hypothetical protein